MENEQTLDERLLVCGDILRGSGVEINDEVPLSRYIAYSDTRENIYYLVINGIDVSTLVDDLFNEGLIKKTLYFKNKKQLSLVIRNLIIIMQSQIEIADNQLKSNDNFECAKKIFDVYSRTSFNLEQFKLLYRQMWDKLNLDTSLYIPVENLFKIIRENDIDFYEENMCKKHKTTRLKYEQTKVYIETYNSRKIPLKYYDDCFLPSASSKRKFDVALEQTMDFDYELYMEFCEKVFENEEYFEKQFKDAFYAIYPYYMDVLENKNEKTITKFLIRYKNMMDMSFQDFLFLVYKQYNLEGDEIFKNAYIKLKNLTVSSGKRRYSFIPSFDETGNIVMFKNDERCVKIRRVINGKEVSEEDISLVTEVLEKNEIPLLHSVVNYAITHYCAGDLNEFIAEVREPRNRKQLINK